MADELIQQFEELLVGMIASHSDVRNTNDYYAMCSIRDELYNIVGREDAEIIASRIKFNISIEYHRTDIKRIVELFTQMIATLVRTLVEDQWTMEAIYQIATTLSLELDY